MSTNSKTRFSRFSEENLEDKEYIKQRMLSLDESRDFRKNLNLRKQENMKLEAENATKTDIEIINKLNSGNLELIEEALRSLLHDFNSSFLLIFLVFIILFICFFSYYYLFL